MVEVHEDYNIVFTADSSHRVNDMEIRNYILAI